MLARFVPYILGAVAGLILLIAALWTWPPLIRDVSAFEVTLYGRTALPVGLTRGRESIVFGQLFQPQRPRIAAIGVILTSSGVPAGTLQLKLARLRDPAEIRKGLPANSILASSTLDALDMQENGITLFRFLPPVSVHRGETLAFVLEHRPEGYSISEIYAWTGTQSTYGQGTAFSYYDRPPPPENQNRMYPHRSEGLQTYAVDATFATYEAPPLRRLFKDFPTPGETGPVIPAHWLAGLFVAFALAGGFAAGSAWLAKPVRNQGLRRSVSS